MHGLNGALFALRVVVNGCKWLSVVVDVDDVTVDDVAVDDVVVQESRPSEPQTVVAVSNWNGRSPPPMRNKSGVIVVRF